MHATPNTLPIAIRARSIARLNRHLAAAPDPHAQMSRALGQRRWLVAPHAAPR